MNFGRSQNVTQNTGGAVVRYSPTNIPRIAKNTSVLLLVVVLSNVFTHSVWNPFNFFKAEEAAAAAPLFLMDEAQTYVSDEKAFEEKVRTVAQKLNVPPEWLMAVMDSESGFDASITNARGSGATGLIQWMPATAKDFNTTVEKLRNMSHNEQLDYVYLYFDTVRKRYREYESLADFYLAVLYPKALEQDYCYTLYATPSQAYQMNSILDEDKDGRVTVSDVDKRMKRVYPEAYIAQKPE